MQPVWSSLLFVSACLPSVEGAVEHARMMGPISNDYNPETTMGGLPFSVECLIAFVWITMVASLPLIVVKLEGGKITNTQIMVFCVMWVVFFAGIFLFTQVLLFQSSHWTGFRPLTMVECVYLMSQILTTVGYGDITPARQRAQVFVALYVIFSLVIIANVLAEVMTLVSAHTEDFSDKLENLKAQWQQAAQPSTAQGLPEAKGEKPTAKQWIKTGVAPLPWKGFLNSCAVYAVFCVIGCTFFVNYPGEGRTVWQGIYMSIITLSTVGFGAFTPLTEGGKVFGAFWMLFGSAALVAVVGTFTELICALKLREQFDPVKAYEDDAELAKQLPERTSACGFLKFGLQHAKLAKVEDLELLERAFHELCPDADGTVSKDAVKSFLEGRHD